MTAGEKLWKAILDLNRLHRFGEVSAMDPTTENHRGEPTAIITGSIWDDSFANFRLLTDACRAAGAVDAVLVQVIDDRDQSVEGGRFIDGTRWFEIFVTLPKVEGAKA